MKEVMNKIGQSNVNENIVINKVELGGVNKEHKTYLVFNENELMGKGYDIFECLKIKYLSAKNTDDKSAADKAYKKLKGWMKETSVVKSANNIKAENGDIPLEVVSSENSSLSSAQLTELCGVNIG